jgi:deazaflavin-dependent oxidoreductase (nitroreductase family)
MKIPSRQSTLKLTHFGRKSGKPFDVTIWFAQIDGGLWIGSLDEDRGWVRNLRATGRARVDFGSGPLDVCAETVADEAGKARYSDAVLSKYPILGRVLRLLVRRKNRAVFQLKPA